MDQKDQLVKAILKVMEAVKGIDKNMTVGKGASAYQGVSDKDVKQIIGKAMQENGLIILPIGVESKTETSRWQETDQYGTKSKQSIFTEVKTKYLLMHESGQSQIIEGYGQGIDTQDKGAGKATTYALKYALLYSFLVPTGKIDDADNEHSDNKDVPPSEFEKELKLAIGRIALCNSKDEIAMLKDIVPPNVYASNQFKDAANKHFLENIKPKQQ